MRRNRTESLAGKESLARKIRIILPTYNERENLGLLIPEIFKILKKNNLSSDVLIVDDNSPDGTANLAEELSKKYPIKVIKRSGKMGLGSAYILGFKESLKDGKDVVFEMDADLSHNPDYIPEFVEKLEHGFDVVIGSRTDGGKVIGWDWYRKMVSWGGNFIGRTLAGIKVNDLTTGYRAYKRAVLESINLDKINSEGYAFQLEILARALNKGFRVRPIPIVFEDRRKGKSKLSRRDMLEFLLIALKIRLGKLKG